MECRIVQLDFSAAFDEISQCGLLQRLKSISIGRQFIFIVSEFFIDKRQRVPLNDKENGSVNVGSEVSQK